MKALKEKRISLRSLWRRGLVILSLFALVFASCNTSGEDDDEEIPVPPQVVKEILTIEVKKQPSNNQYEATKIDLTGLELKVTYDDLNEATLTPATTKFKTIPEIAQGSVLWGADSASGTTSVLFWAGMTKCTVTWAEGGNAYSTDVTIKVVPILRGMNTAHTQFETGPAIVPVGNASMYYQIIDPAGVAPIMTAIGTNSYMLNSALNLTGNLDKTVYIDELPSFDGFRLQATYTDGKKQDIPLDVNNKNTRFEIRPYYNNGHDKTGRGDLVVTVGLTDNIDSRLPALGNISIKGAVSLGTAKALPSGWAGVASINGYLTAIHPYEEVYHILGISVDPAPNAEDWESLPSMYYWEDDITNNGAGTNKSTDFWKGKLKDKGFGLKVRYSDGTEKLRSIDDAEKGGKGILWQDKNKYTNDWSVFGVSDVVTASKGNKATVALSKIGEPVVNLYYRGAEVAMPVDIWNKVEAFDVVYKNEIEGGTLLVDMRANNDIGRDAKWFADQVSASISLSSARGGSKSMDVSFYSTGNLGGTWQETGVPQLGTSAAGVQYNHGVTDASNNYTASPKAQIFTNASYYGMDFDAQSKMTANNGKTKNVTLYYATPEGYGNSGISSKLLKNRLSVQWIIP